MFLRARGRTPDLAHPTSRHLWSHAGLLHNWGVGLLSLGTHCPPPEAARGVAALSEAAERFSASAGFNRGDPAPLNGLGDVRMAQACTICPPM